jgi:uncharacterized protein YigE (DUF2233 family)
MHRKLTIAGSFVTVALLSAGLALAQQPKADCKSAAKERVEGQVVRVDTTTNRVTVREKDGTTHEFQANAETLKDMKPGDQIEAKLREAPKC